jgi:hypothetical protein
MRFIPLLRQDSCQGRRTRTAIAALVTATPCPSEPRWGSMSALGHKRSLVGQAWNMLGADDS